MTLRSVGTKAPTVPGDAFVDESALIIGGVTLGSRTSVWPCALIRADDGTVDIGEGSAVMDMAFIEAPLGRSVKIGRGCLVSHGARLHGCVLDDGVLVGVGAIVLDGARIGMGSVVAAGCVVPPGKEIQPKTVVSGVPAATARPTGPADEAALNEELKALRSKAERYLI
jgi:carbonic anhydrase/acetyltransferase-like protein (isoleucine patch superfamily)